VPIKYALKQAGIIESDEVRLPLSQISAEVRAILDPLMFELELT
jgi:dihydrodipicolinate synthase/N-acetylneuraminate lyase